MRRNLRLDWRALALLGALLSIIIDWPGLIYAMPTILPAVAVVAAPGAAAAAAASDTLNVIKNDKILNVNPFEEHDHEHHVRPRAKDEFTGQSTENLSSFATNRPFSDMLTERTNREPEQLQSVSVSGGETQTQTKRHLTTYEKQEVKANLNSISHKQINDNKPEELETASHYDGTPQNSQTESTATTTTKETVANVEAALSSSNTHIMNSTIDALTPTSQEPLIILSTTTESSARIQSTLMPSTITDNDSDSDNDNDNDNNDAKKSEKSNHNNNNILSTFQFSSSNHLAILSRTERSIRSSSSTMNTKNIGGVGGSVGSTGIVRRSSDMSGVKTKRLNNYRNLHNKNNLDRNERSTVSHLSGPSRKIQLYIKNRFLQLMPDGTVNGTQDEISEYTILQRSTVDVGRIKVQGVATCLYLCMDPCGAVYGSKDFTDDCVFNENMEQHNYNTYSSTYNSNARRKYYLALNRHGEPRKLQIPPTRSLGKLATYTNAITETVPQERVEQLIAKNFGANRIKHGIRQLCDTGKPLIELIDSKNFKAQPKCNPNTSNSNSNSNSNSHNEFSYSKNKNNHNNSKNSLSSSSSSSSNSNSGQLLNNVPAANDKSKLSNSSSSSSSSSRNSNNSNSRSTTNSNSSSSSSSSTSHSSISNSQNNGHISNSNSTTLITLNSERSSSSSGSGSGSGSGSSSSMKANGDRGKKLRKCRPHENEEEHNCHRRPHPLRNPGKQKRCRELLLQQQQEGITDIVLPPMCQKKKGPKKQGAKVKRPPGEAPRGKNGLGTDGLGPNNRRGKKLNGGGGGNGRQAAKQNQNGANGSGGGGPKKKQKNPNKRGGGGGGGGGPGGNGNKKKPAKTSTTTTTTTTEHTSTSDSTSTLKPGFWETSSYMPSSTLFETYDPQAESTSDRGDREQRNVRYDMDASMEVSAEDTSAANDEGDEDEGDMEGDTVDADDNEESSYEDDTYIASSSHMPYAETDAAHTPLTGGADDFLYYDQLDV